MVSIVGAIHESPLQARRNGGVPAQRSSWASYGTIIIGAQKGRKDLGGKGKTICKRRARETGGKSEDLGHGEVIKTLDKTLFRSINLFIRQTMGSQGFGKEREGPARIFSSPGKELFESLDFIHLSD